MPHDFNLHTTIVSSAPGATITPHVTLRRFCFVFVLFFKKNTSKYHLPCHKTSHLTNKYPQIVCSSLTDQCPFISFVQWLHSKLILLSLRVSAAENTINQCRSLSCYGTPYYSIQLHGKRIHGNCLYLESVRHCLISFLPVLRHSWSQNWAWLSHHP